MLQPTNTNKTFQARTRAKAKMFEFSVPAEQHINLEGINLSNLLDLTIGILGTLAAGNQTEEAGEQKFRLLFSAQYFDALVEGRTVTEYADLIKLLAAASFFLADYPGSTQVILKNTNEEPLSDFGRILFSILRRTVVNLRVESDTRLTNLSESWNRIVNGQSTFDDLNPHITALRAYIYNQGRDEDVLLIDLIKAVLSKRAIISSKRLLAEFSGAGETAWDQYFSRESAVKEFWPSQVRLAEKGVFGGTSAIVQMPTSAGKTRATEFIIRSAFLSNRTSLAVVIAPFRALCQEIYNDFLRNFGQDENVYFGLVSDVLQDDLEFIQNRKSVLILTPEKFDFLLRYRPELAERIGLIIYDEGHLFDDPARGIKYELLLSSLKTRLPTNAQVVLISAVIANALEVKDWLLGEAGTLVDGKDLSPTSRNIAFVDWNQRSRFLQFVDTNDISQSLFFVPTVLQSHELERKPQERVARFYPATDRSGRYLPSQVAGFLGCRLSSGGLAAIFTGRKDSAQKIAREIVDAYERNLPVTVPIEFTTNLEEANKVSGYIVRTLGTESVYAQAAALGVLLHHANVPHGLRLVTEQALQEGHFKTVICTSTLAQGVNLPIRYLVVSSDRQGRERMRVRDFHNLMGRAGRSGKYTEGTVIFADPNIYRSRLTGAGSRWSQTEQLLNPENSEPSTSRLLLLLKDPETFDDEVKEQYLKEIDEIKREIYSYLLVALAMVEDVIDMERIVGEIARNTLGFSQIQLDEDKTRLIGIFVEIGTQILTELPDLNSRPIFSRTILSLEQANRVLEFLRQHKESIVAEDANLLNELWPIIYEYCTNSALRSLGQENSLTICSAWISGESYISLNEIRTSFGVGQSEINQIIELCESGFSYGCSVLLSSITELISLVVTEDELPRVSLGLLKLQKLLKYGVSSMLKARIYEMGFADRELVGAIVALLGDIDEGVSRSDLAVLIKNQAGIQELLSPYPLYFRNMLSNLS